ncbi:uncharacterized protein E6C27_scaffold977G00040 [Cucumis melo var. makuwa]|uniref:Retrotransposon gag domain-containing protein n=1 Tax=Cucumis melo var. makuwa TaxID=1194695 RepID=A0A5A7V5R3_CUCMM|nr:uncharacterized protein E6C27_scaffold977G00040 [Cucumis melo var. makuwa]
MQQGQEVKILSWEGFQEKFYTHSFVDAKRKEFLNLKQGNMTIAEYERKFTKLAKYVISLIMDKEDKQVAMRVVNTQVGEGKNSKEKRPSAEMSKEKGNDEGFNRRHSVKKDMMKDKVIRREVFELKCYRVRIKLVLKTPVEGVTRQEEKAESKEVKSEGQYFCLTQDTGEVNSRSGQAFRASSRGEIHNGCLGDMPPSSCRKWHLGWGMIARLMLKGNSLSAF